MPTFLRISLLNLLLVCLTTVTQNPITISRIQEKPASFERPILIRLEGPIDWQSAKYLRSKIQAAKGSSADLIIIEIESPGGLKTESLNLAEQLRDINWAYTVAYIPKEALSGAALISLGCDEIWLGELARYGDIGVIQYDPSVMAFRYAPEKIQSVLISQARDLAIAKGRPPELAEAMIDKDFVVYQRIVDNKIEFLGQKSEQDKPEGNWKVVEETTKGFLTINGSRTVALGIGKGITADRQQLANQIGFEIEKTRIVQQTLTDSIVYYLNHPVITVLLILVGLVALFFELSSPGIGIGALTSGLCAALFFWSRFLGGTSTVLELVLFAAGVVFVLMELFVIPGFGIPGVAGILLMISSVFLASQDFIVPSSEHEWNQVVSSSLVLLCSGGMFLVAAGLLIRHFEHIPILSQMVLAPPESEEQMEVSNQLNEKPNPVEHPLVSAGDWGVSDSLLRPAGRAIFAGRSFDVVSDGEFIEPGTQIKIIAISGNRIVVSAISDSNQ